MFAWPNNTNCLSQGKVFARKKIINKKPAPKRKANSGSKNFKPTPIKEFFNPSASENTMSGKTNNAIVKQSTTAAQSEEEDGYSSTSNQPNEVTESVPKETGYRLRNHSYQQSLGTPTTPQPKEATKTLPAIEQEDLDEMGSIEDILPPKFLLKKEEFDKKNHTNKLDNVFEAVNKLYNMHISVQTRVKSLEFAVFDEQDGILPQLQGIAEHAKGAQSKQDIMTKEMVAMREELEIAKGLIHKQSNQIRLLQARQADIVARSMSDNLTIAGIKHDDGKSEDKILVANFLEKELEIDVDEFEEIQVAHRLGQFTKGAHRPIVFRCPPTLRKKIFENTYKLAGKDFSINQQLPEAIAEQKREFRQAIKEMKKAEEGKDEQDKSTFLVRNNKLYINGQLQRKQLMPPKPADLFSPPSEIKKMEKIKMKSVQSQPVKGSQFTAYACVVTSLNEVHLAYKKLFRENPEADHIMAACATQGMEAYQDDGEFGAGFRLLYMIRESKLLDVAVFVVRHYGGEHLGPQRFTMIRETANEALAKLS